MKDRKKHFLYEDGDLETVTNQCKDCRYNAKNLLSCQKYVRIPNGTRSSKVKCPYKEINN